MKTPSSPRPRKKASTPAAKAAAPPSTRPKTDAPTSPSVVLEDGPAREAIRFHTAANLAVDAGAGTGKTRELLERVLHLVAVEGVPLTDLAVLTFTDKAAGELLERLRWELYRRHAGAEAADQARLAQALEDLESASVCTLHSLCAQILREQALAAGLDPRFGVLDETQAVAFQEECWEEWLGMVLSESAPEVTEALDRGVSLASVVRLKDFLLRHRFLLAPGTAPEKPDPSPARAALQNAWVRLEKILADRPDAGDSLVKESAKVRSDLVALAEVEGSESAPLLLALKFRQGHVGSAETWGEAKLAEAREIWAFLRNEAEKFRLAYGDWVLRNLAIWLGRYLTHYERRKRERGAADFDDLLIWTRDLLRNQPSVREALRRRWTRVFVDEFQDTDPLQVEIVFLLAGAADARIDPGRLFLVGDPKQSIYRFRRADVEGYRAAREKVAQGPGGEGATLTRNFRTVAPLVDWVNRKFSEVFAVSGEPFVPLRAHRGQAPEGAEPPVTAFQVPKETAGTAQEAEGMAVAAYVADLIRRAPPVWDKELQAWRPLRAGDVAVLFRNLSGHEEAFENAFRKLEVPTRVVGGKRFYARSEVTLLGTLLECLSAPAEELWTVAVLRSPLFGFTDERLFLYRARKGVFRFLEDPPEGSDPDGRVAEAFAALKSWREALQNRPLSQALRMLLDATPILSFTEAQPHGAQRVANLVKLVDQAGKLEETESLSFRDFARWLKRRREEETLEEQAPPPDLDDSAVSWMTVHKSKGLEFPVVVLAGWAQKQRGESFRAERGTGRLEIKMADLETAGYAALAEREKREEAEELKRLLYVAATRARDALVVPFPEGLDPDKNPLGWIAADWMDGKTGEGERLVPCPEFPERLRNPEAFRVRLRREEAGTPAVAAAREEWERWRKKREERRASWKPTFELRTAHSSSEAAEPSTRPPGNFRVESAGSSGKDFGILVHDLLNVDGGSGGDFLKKAATAWAEDLREAEKALRLVEAARRSPVLQRAQKSEKVFRELPVTVREGEVLLDGRIDLAFLEGGEWVVVDYKTDLNPETRKSQYEEQVRFYAELLEKSTHCPVREAHLLWLGQGPEGGCRDTLVPLKDKD